MKISAFLFAVSLLPALVDSELPLPDACDDPDISAQGFCVPDCHCVPDDPADCDTCPDVGNRMFTTESVNERAFFAELEVVESSLFRFDPPGCQPFPAVAFAFQQTPCEGVATTAKTESKNGGPTQCSFKYKKANKKGNGGVCETKQYSIVEEPAIKQTKGKATKSKGAEISVTHEGSCGVCSTAQDLAVNLSPTLSQDSQSCTIIATGLLSTNQMDMVWPSLLQCFGALGFSEQCAFLWSSNSLNTLFTLQAAIAAIQAGEPFQGPPSCAICATTCLADPTAAECQLPLMPGTCDLAPCVACDEEASGPLFKLYGGRTRRNSGIINTFVVQTGVDTSAFVGIKRPCSTIANIGQPALECPV